jgi:hypothetical protein
MKASDLPKTSLANAKWPPTMCASAIQRINALTSSANTTLWSGTAFPASNATKHEQTYKVAARWPYEAQGVWLFPYVGCQSNGRISSPSACNFSSARLAYTRTLPESSAAARMRSLRQTRACRVFAGPKTPEGRNRIRLALLKHGCYAKEAKQERVEWYELVHGSMELLHQLGGPPDGQ